MKDEKFKDEKLKKCMIGIVERIIDDIDSNESIQHRDQSLLPDPGKIVEVLNLISGIIFPGYFAAEGRDPNRMRFFIGHAVSSAYDLLSREVMREARHMCQSRGPECDHCSEWAGHVTLELLEAIPRLRGLLEKDVKAAHKNDPAATGYDEIIIAYPGVSAILIHRIAHCLHKAGLRLIPRLMNEYAHGRTGVDIHPGASIGESFFIDHGTGVVIGETTVIGKRVAIYQGVTLGALNFPRDSKGNIIKGARRHPTIEDDVVIYSGATILGGNTVIGAGSTIGGNVWLTSSVPAGTRVVMGKSGKREEKCQSL